MKAIKLIVMVLLLSSSLVQAQEQKHVIYQCVRGSKIIFQDKACPQGFTTLESKDYELSNESQKPSHHELVTSPKSAGLDTLIANTNEALIDRKYNKIVSLKQKIDDIKTELGQAPLPNFARQQQLLKARALLEEQLTRYENEL